MRFLTDWREIGVWGPPRRPASDAEALLWIVMAADPGPDGKLTLSTTYAALQSAWGWGAKTTVMRWLVEMHRCSYLTAISTAEATVITVAPTVAVGSPKGPSAMPTPRRGFGRGPDLTVQVDAVRARYDAEVDQCAEIVTGLARQWNERTAEWGLPCVLHPTSVTRLRRIHARLRDGTLATIQKAWPAILEEVHQSEFLRGMRGRNTWTGITFDWLTCSPHNWLKVLEGNYRDSRGRQAPQVLGRNPTAAELTAVTAGQPAAARRQEAST